MFGNNRPLLLIVLTLVLLVAAGVDLFSHAILATVLTILAGVTILALLAYEPEQVGMPATEPPPVAATNYSALLIAAISDPVMIVNNRKVTRANAAARALLGDHIVDQEVRVALRHPSLIPLLAESADDGTIEAVGIGGRDQHWEVRISTISPGTRVIQMVDRTARYAAERARTDFVANASHELRTPLAAILGFIETLEDDSAGGDPKTRARFLSVMAAEARRMQRLIDDLISLSRIEAERHQPPQGPIDLALLIAQSARELKSPQGDAANIILDFAVDLPPVAGDRMQLQQLVHNLLSNALKYGRTNAPVRVVLEHESPKSLKLQVIDQGEGIAAEHIPRLTERFYRVDSARSRAGGGTGLGLAIVKHIVERHRGRLEIASIMGTGTTVSVSFPV
jgi:two-component system phosphate regulon sensor histidine kinase PhoR